jgi:uncharacterized protein (DUF885 family)
MVIDASIHTKGWTRQQALDYLLGHTVLPERIAQGEIDRQRRAGAQREVAQ